MQKAKEVVHLDGGSEAPAMAGPLVSPSDSVVAVSVVEVED